MDTTDLINSAAANDPSAFMDALNAIMNDKAGEALNTLRNEVAQTIIEPEVDDESTDEVSDEQDNEVNNDTQDNVE